MSQGKKNKMVKSKRTQKKQDKKVPVQEALLSYNLALLRDELFRLAYKKTQLKQTLSSKMKKLSNIQDDCEKHIGEVVKQMREHSEEHESVKDSTSVLGFMRETWKLKADEELKLKELEVKITRVRRELNATNLEIAQWHEFETVTKPLNQERIDLLKKDKQQLADRFKSIAAYMEEHTRTFQSELNHETLKTLSETKQNAVRWALDTINSGYVDDQFTLKLLQKECDTLCERQNTLTSEIEKLQSQNIRIQEQIGQAEVTQKIFPSALCTSSQPSGELTNTDSMFDLKIGEYFSRLQLNDAHQSVLLDAKDIDPANRRDSDGSLSDLSSVIKQKESMLMDKLNLLVREQFESKGWHRVLALGSLEDHQLLCVIGANAN